MQSQRPSWLLGMETSHHDSRRDDEEKHYRGDDPMGKDETVILWDVAETVAHAFHAVDRLAIGTSIKSITNLPLYRMVSKFSPTRFGSKNVFRCESQVPSPTYMLLDEYELLPGCDSCAAGAMAGCATRKEEYEGVCV